MKRITFVVAALLAASTSFAQTTTTSTPQQPKANHGQTVSTTAHSTATADITTNTSGKGETIREVAKEKQARAEKQNETTKAHKTELKAQTQEELSARRAEAKELRKAAREKQNRTQEAVDQTSAESQQKVKAGLGRAENHGQKVSTVATETPKTGFEKGQQVKEAATEESQARASRRQPQTNTTVHARTSAARRAKVGSKLSTKGLKQVKVTSGSNLKTGGR